MRGAANHHFVVLGGTEIGDDVGYGPAGYLTVDEVQAAADAMKDIPPEKLGARYVASELAKNEIYPEIWDDAVGYLATWYETPRGYYINAAAQGQAMLKYLN